MNDKPKRIKRAKAGIPEKKVVRIWQKRLRRQRVLTGTGGEELEVVYPGRLNDSRGGDFKDAVVASGPQLHYGCIEIHSSTSGWRAHGHQADTHYNQVVLHVAMEGDCEGITLRQDGQVVPTVLLDRQMPAGTAAGRNGFPPRCRAVQRKRKSGELIALLEKAGIKRLTQKAGRFRQELSDPDEGQSLYLGIMEALGYARNSRPFLELGCLVTLKEADKMLGWPDRRQPLTGLQAVLLGTAGLLPSQRRLPPADDPYIRDLERAWADVSGHDFMSRQDWEMFRVRPGNSPVRRIIALSYLVLRFHEPGLKQWLEDLALRAQSRAGLNDLLSALIVEAGGYWDGHYELAPSPQSASSQSAPSQGGCRTNLLGRERAQEIIINVLLPFLRFRLETGRAPVPEDVIRAIYCRFPRLESNSIERHMQRQLGLDSRQVNSACLQQGLIQVYRQSCIRGKCTECSLEG